MSDKFLQSKKTALSLKEAEKYLAGLGKEFVLIENPDYIFAPYEICPLARKIKEKRDRIVAIVQDMDGTTTTTEALCLYSLEYMVRCFTGRMDKKSWHGLDRRQDYPHIIGNSTTRHVEYLLRAYLKYYKENYFKQAFVRASLLTLAFGKDEKRKRETLTTLKHFGLKQLQEDPIVQAWFKEAAYSQTIFFPGALEKNLTDWAGKFALETFNDQVRAAIEIYYQRYHEILFKIDNGLVKDLKQLIPDGHAHFIEPMPGVAIFLAAIKGWLGQDLKYLEKDLRKYLEETDSCSGEEASVKNSGNILSTLGKYFQDHPVKTAVVTSSIFYEADIVLKQVFEVMKRQIGQWDIGDEKKRMILRKFEDYRQVFDEVITASDSSEIRLKPHRDLYSLALRQLGIEKKDYDYVIGFEDSESGTIAIRAAGIGCCIAVPFVDTSGHNLSYASYILPCGLPEAILVHHFFLNIKNLS